MLSPRTGLGVLETAVLAAVHDLGGVPGAGRRRTDRVLDALERSHGVGARYAYPLVCDLAVPWRLHLPLLDVEGNTGSQYGDPAADARYTEVRLSPVGALAVAAERGEVGPVPLGLVEGSLYRDGPVPPFDPARVVEALTTGSGDAGPPALPTGGTVTGDLDALLRGVGTRLQLGCEIVREDGQLVITRVPLGVHVELVSQLLDARTRERRVSRRLPDQPPADPVEPPRAPIGDVRDEGSMHVGLRVVCVLAPGADPDAAEAWVRSVWPVTTEVDVRLPAPQRHRLRDWDAGDGSGLEALVSLL